MYTELLDSTMLLRLAQSCHSKQSISYLEGSICLVLASWHIADALSDRIYSCGWDSRSASTLPKGKLDWRFQRCQLSAKVRGVNVDHKDVASMSMSALRLVACLHAVKTPRSAGQALQLQAKTGEAP